MGEPPNFLKMCEWLRDHGRTYFQRNKGFSVLVIVLFIVFCFHHDIFKTFCAAWHAIKGDKIVATVIAFNQCAATATVRFDKRTESPVIISSVYFTITPDNHSSIKPLPNLLRDQVSLFDKMAIQIPSGAGFGIVDGKKFQLVVFLLEPDCHLLLGKGSIVTNLCSPPESFHSTCQQLSDGSSMELGIHFSLVDATGERHEVQLPLGMYSMKGAISSLDGEPLPRSISLIPSPPLNLRGKRGSEILVKVGDKRILLPSGNDVIDKPYRLVLYRNLGPYTAVVTISDEPKELIPVVLVDQNVLVGINFAAYFNGVDDHIICPRILENVVSQDEGETRTVLATLVSNAWQEVSALNKSNSVYEVKFPKSNFQLLVGEDKWTEMSNFILQFTVERTGWVKLFPPGEVTQGTIRSNRLVFAGSSTSRDPTWNSITNVDKFLSSTTGFVVVCETKFVLDPKAITNLSFEAIYLGDMKQ